MSTYGTHEVPGHRAPPRRARTAVLTLTAALTIALTWAAGTLWWHTHHVPAPLVTAQQHLSQQLDQAFAEQTKGGPKPGVGGYALARLWLPTLGLRLNVVEGVTLDDIRWAPGHFPGSAMPGQVGNFAVAGHRSPGIFIDLDRLRPGDPIIVETARTWFTYRATSMRATPPDAVAEVAPVPPGAKPGTRLLTLTTCISATDNTRRLVWHAVLERTSPHDAPPKELG